MDDLIILPKILLFCKLLVLNIENSNILFVMVGVVSGKFLLYLTILIISAFGKALKLTNKPNFKPVAAK